VPRNLIASQSVVFMASLTKTGKGKINENLVAAAEIHEES